MAWIFGTTILLTALIITPGYLFYFDVTPKLVILLLGTAASAAGMIVGRTSRSFPFRAFSWILAGSTVSLALATRLSANPALSAFGTNWRRFGALPQFALLLFAWLLAGYTAGRPDRVQAILRFIVPAAGLAGLYGILQYFGWDPLLPVSAYHVGEGVWTIVRPPGTMGYVSYFATWLLGAAFLCAELARMERPGWWRAAAVVSGSIAICAMLLTGTRAAMFGLAVGVLVWVAVRRSRLPARMVLSAILILAGVVAFYFSPPGRQLRSRARWFTEDPLGGSRLLLWRDGLRMASDRLAVGNGPEVFTAKFPLYESVQLARAYPDFFHESPHNIFLDSLIGQGIPGCALLLATCGLGFWYSRRHPLLAAALAGIVAAQQFTVFVLPTALLFFLVVALLVALASQPAERRLSLPLRTCFVVVAVILSCYAARYAVADRALARAARSIANGDPAAASVFYGTYDRWRFPGTSAALWYSRALYSLGRAAVNPAVKIQALAQSGAAALRATDESEDSGNAWYNLAALYASQNDSARTESALRSAIRANPRWFKPHWMLAQVLSLSGRAQAAEQEAALAVALNGGKNAEVAVTWSQIREKQ